MTRDLVPIVTSKRRSISTGLSNLFGTPDVTALGYPVFPEQTAPDHARCQYEKRAVDALEDITAEFRQTGGEVDYRLVFTHRRKQTVQSYADTTDSQAFAIPETTGPIKRLLVLLSGERATESFQQSLL